MQRVQKLMQTLQMWLKVDLESLSSSHHSVSVAGCVEFGPDVTSSDKSVKVMLNSQDKVGLTLNAPTVGCRLDAVSFLT